MKLSVNSATSVVAGLILLLLAHTQANAASSDTEPQVSAQQFVDLQQGDTTHKGYRRAHAKGVCISGEFISNGNLAEYTSAPIFAVGKSPFSGRFSIAGNNPHSADLAAPVRSLALNFVLAANNQWRIAMNTPPVMAVTNPQDFYAQLMAIKNGPEAIKAFYKAHPESKDFLNWASQYKPSNSFSGETYHSINAFYLTNHGKKHAVRWMAVPYDAAEAPEVQGNNALQARLAAQLSEKPVVFDWQFQFADAADDPDNPAVKWPDARSTVSAGKLVIHAWQEQLQGSCHSLNFDPNVLPEGILATDDPILKARSAAYAESYKRRAIEVFNGALQGEH